MKNKEFICKYWGRTKLGREMIKSNNVSESDLLFLIPNNVKRMHGLPLTRISGKKKRKQKEQRKRFILSFKLFDLIEEAIEKTLRSEWTENEWFGQFIDVNNLPHTFSSNEPFDESKIVTIPTSRKPIRIYFDSK